MGRRKCGLGVGGRPREGQLPSLSYQKAGEGNGIRRLSSTATCSLPPFHKSEGKGPGRGWLGGHAVTWVGPPGLPPPGSRLGPGR